MTIELLQKKGNSFITISQSQLKQNYFEWIDILRGLAAFGVVLFHVRIYLWVGWQAIQSHPEQFSKFDKLLAYFSIPFPFLGSSVMLFFILSGYCIHYPTALNKRIELKSYTIRRLIRIVPPYIMAVLFSLFIERISKYSFGRAGSDSLTILRTFFMIQNYPPLPKQLSSNASLWSLPIELELYILYPMLFWLGNYVGRKVTLFGVAIVSILSLYFILRGTLWLEGNFSAYWIIWCSGAALAHIIKQDKLPRWKNFFFIPMIVFFIAGGIMVTNQLRGIDHLSWAAGYLLLLWYCLSSPSPSSFLPKTILKCLLWLGKISFSLYLIHFPLFVLLGNFWINRQDTKPSSLLISFAASFLALLVADIFYRIVEKPFHKLARYLGTRNN